jgi:hypothetical protein
MLNLALTSKTEGSPASKIEEPEMCVSFLYTCKEKNRKWREIVASLTEIIISKGRNSFTFI